MNVAHPLQHVSSGGLALLVHGAFLVALVFGVSWKNPPPVPVEAELWAALPQPPAPLPAPAPPAPPPAVVAAPEADIALEQEQRRRAEAERQAKLEQAQARRRQEQELARQEIERRETEVREQARLEQLKRDRLRRQMEQELALRMREELDAESDQLRAVRERSRADARALTINEFKRRIQDKIHSYVRLPPRLSGNPEAEFHVFLLPNGEVMRVTLMRPSGQPAYDKQVELAILMASPLPLPNEKETAAAFRDGLTLRFRPYENGPGVN